MKIRVYIHACNLGPCKSILEGQLERLLSNELIMNHCDHICVGVVGPDLKIDRDRVKIVHHSANVRLWEHPTLNYLLKEAQDNPEPDLRVLYIHTKGITHRGPIYNHVQDWKELMEYFLIDKVDQCLKYLETYQTIGCNLNCDRKIYEGNFWWATGSYLATKKPLMVDAPRQKAEDWLLADETTMSAHKCIYHSKPHNHYAHPYPKNIYQQ